MKNLFSPTFGNKPQQLLGRDEWIEQLSSGLQTPPGSRERAVLITGQRGYGKTVLLLEIAERARKMGFVVASPTVVSPDMPNTILDKLQRDVAKPGEFGKRSVTGGSVGAFGFSAGIQINHREWEARSFSVRLDMLCEAINKQKRGVLILADEVQSGSEELKQLVITYQELVGAGRDAALFMAGLPAAISGVLNDKVLTFLNRAEKIVLPPIRTGQIEGYYKRAFREEGVSLSDELLEEAAEKTQGSPYMMQLIGYYITQFAKEDGNVSKKEMQKALAHAEADFQNDICLTVLRTLSDTDVKFLHTMAGIGESVNVSDIAKKMNVSREYAQQYRRRLLDAGIIESKKRGVVEFAVPYLRDYLCKEEQ